MAKLSRSKRPVIQTPRSTGTIMIVLKGVLISLAVSLLFIFLLTLFSLVSQSTVLEGSTPYVMIAVTLISIFIGSTWASYRAQSRGLIIGISVGALYILLSMIIGMEMTQDTLSVSVLANKLFAGLAAGALGGFVGVNL